MFETNEERAVRMAHQGPIRDEAFAMAVAAEIALTSERCPSRQYEAGKIDACVAILKAIQPEIDWLADIRMAAIMEKSAV